MIGTATVLMFRWSLLVLGCYDPASLTSSSEWSQSRNLGDSNKPVEQCEQSLDHLQFVSSYWWRIHQYFPWVSIYWYLQGCSRHLGLQSASLNHRLLYYVLASQKFRLEFDNSGPAGFSTQISWTKSGFATIVLHSIDFLYNLKTCKKTVIQGCVISQFS